MWNLIMWVWFVACMFAPILVIYQAIKGVKMTPRELYFYFFGVFIAGLPFIYIVNR